MTPHRRPSPTHRLADRRRSDPDRAAIIELYCRYFSDRIWRDRTRTAFLSSFLRPPRDGNDRRPRRRRPSRRFAVRPRPAILAPNQRFPMPHPAAQEKP
jgi:hypothetical protein